VLGGKVVASIIKGSWDKGVRRGEKVGLGRNQGTEPNREELQPIAEKATFRSGKKGGRDFLGGRKPISYYCVAECSRGNICMLVNRLK